MFFRQISLSIMIFWLSAHSFAFDDLSNQWTLDFMYHYGRTERTTLVTTDNFLTRQGAMIQGEYEEQLDLFWRWYVGGDFTFARYEAAATTSVTPRERLPWQLYIGTGFQMGSFKNFEIFFGAGGSSEHYLRAEGPARYSFEQTNSLRAHLGFHWRFLSIIGSSSKLTFRYSTPITTVSHGDTGDLRYAGILDGTLRLRPYYNSTFSLYGGVRFEDYKTVNRGVTYFTSRIYAGLGIHF